jgi:uncharacterized protein YkwD
MVDKLQYIWFLMQKILPRFAIVVFLIITFLLIPNKGLAAYSFSFSYPSIPSSPSLQPFPTQTHQNINGKGLSPTVFPSKTPTSKPSVTPTRIPTKQPTVTILPTSSTPQTDVKKLFIMNAINNYRKSLGLSVVSTNNETCNFAKTRAQEIVTDFSHTAFTNRINSGTLPYRTWTQITENIAMNSDYKNVVNMWINSPGHAANMQKDTPYVCVESSGNYYAYEGMKP